MGCRNETVYIMACPRHIVNNTAGKVAHAFEIVTGFNIGSTGPKKAPRESLLCVITVALITKIY